MTILHRPCALNCGRQVSIRCRAKYCRTCYRAGARSRPPKIAPAMTRMGAGSLCLWVPA